MNRWHRSARPAAPAGPVWVSTKSTDAQMQASRCDGRCSHPVSVQVIMPVSQPMSAVHPCLRDNVEATLSIAQVLRVDQTRTKGLSQNAYVDCTKHRHDFEAADFEETSLPACLHACLHSIDLPEALDVAFCSSCPARITIRRE